MIKGNNIYLEPITDQYTDRIIKWRNSENVKKYFLDRETLTIEKHRSWLKNVVETGKAVQFVIFESSGWPIGSVYLRDVDRKNRNAEFGIYIGEETERGKGYGSEALELICKYGFSELGLHKITLRVLQSNAKAINVYKKMGFVHEGCFKDQVFADGKYESVCFMALFEPNGRITVDKGERYENILCNSMLRK